MKWNEFATNLTGEWEIERERKRKRKLRKSIRIMRYHAMGWAHISEFLYKPLYCNLWETIYRNQYGAMLYSSTYCASDTERKRDREREKAVVLKRTL